MPLNPRCIISSLSVILIILVDLNTAIWVFPLGGFRIFELGPLEVGKFGQKISDFTGIIQIFPLLVDNRGTFMRINESWVL